MNISDFKGLLREGVVVCTGPFRFLIKSPVASVERNLATLYEDFPITSYNNEIFCDFHVHLRNPSVVRGILYPQAQFYVDDSIVFNPFPLTHATAMLEWGMNWCVSTQIHTYLIVHAAVIEKAGRAIVMPAPPGSGKSTLCASLIQEGWRLLSDELALIDLESLEVVPMPRPVGLKNDSINIIKRRYPDIVLGVVSSDTLKGSVCHFKPPKNSIEMQHVACPIGWIVFPKYEAGSNTRLITKPKGQAYMEVANNSFNYSALGIRGFNVLKGVIDRAECFSFKYSCLDEAIEVFKSLPRTHEI